MKVSFVIPAYNEEALIGACLKSVLTEIERIKCEAEVIVVNNASKDATKKIALSFFNVTVVDEPIKGLVQARRRGFLVSKGELIANIDADTVLPEGWLDTVLSAFSSSSKLVALSGPYIYYDVSAHTRILTSTFYRVSYLFYILNKCVLRVGSMLQGGNFVVRRSAMNKIGGYNLDFSFYGEDTDLARRLNKVGDVKFSFDLPAYSSGRRFKGEGIFLVGWRYSINFLWATFMKRPFTVDSADFRDECLENRLPENAAK